MRRRARGYESPRNRPVWKQESGVFGLFKEERPGRLARYSRVMDTDPTVVAVGDAVCATDWFQVPRADNQLFAILRCDPGVLTAIQLQKQ